MTATTIDINNYLTSIMDAQSDYAKNIALDYRLGRSECKVDKIKLITLSFLVRAMKKYFAKTDYENNNLYTKDEARDVMEKINKICNTFIYIEI